MPSTGRFGSTRTMACTIILTVAGCRGPSVRPEVPVPVPAARGLNVESSSSPDPLARVVAGPRSTCAVTESGRVVCWGFGSRVDPGENEPAVAAVPPVSTLVAGDGVFCAATRSAGDVWCWGTDGSALGRASEATDTLEPEPVPYVRGVDELVHRQGRTCARNPDGEVWCWGAGLDTPEPMPTPSSAGPVVIDDEGRLCSQHPLACGEQRFDVFERVWPIDEVGWGYEASEASCSLDGRGHVTCRGNMAALLESDPPPNTVSGSLQIGAKHVCGLDSASVAWCRGEDDIGQRGNPGALGPVRSLAVGSEHTCVVTNDARLLCWGSAWDGQVGAPIPARQEPHPVKAILDGKPSGLVRFGEAVCVRTDEGVACPAAHCGRAQFIATGFERAGVGTQGETCLFNPGGEARCKNPLTRSEDVWSNADAPSMDARLGESDGLWCIERGRITPCDDEERKRTDGSLSAVSTRPYEACGLTRAGALQCWLDRRGEGRAHRFDGTFSSVTLAQRLARRSDGTFVWILDDEPGLEDMPVPGLSLVSSDGWLSACGLDGDGAAWCWRAPDGKAERVKAKSRFVDLVHARRVSCAIDDTAQLWCWGSAESGKLGNGISWCAANPYDVTEQVHRALAKP